MSALALIPARAGSKGVAGKNLAEVAGRSLLRRAIDAVVAAGNIDDVAVSSDGDEILAAAELAGAVPLRRPVEIAGDTATSESALVDALEQWERAGRARPDATVFVQCTSPFIDPVALAHAVERVRSGAADVAFAAAPSHSFVWKLRPDGSATGVNHDERVRLRRQDRDAEYAETGAFYVMRTAGFLEHRHRFFGRVEIAPVDPSTAIEIDDPTDLAMARSLAPLVDDASPWPTLGDVDALVMDFDGVHTDNSAVVDQDGVESVRVDRSDGMGLAMLRDASVKLLILSKERNPVVLRRAEKLRIECIAGCDDKISVLREWAEAAGVDPERMVYVGNDINDRDCLQWVGWPMVVGDAHPDVTPLARCVTTRPGGRGALREIVDHLVRSPSTVTNQEG